MKVLVTGGAGFIGSHIAEACCKLNGHVVVLDDLSLGSTENLKWAKSSDRLEFVQGSIDNEKLVRDLLQGCDWVFNEAAIPSVPLSVEKPVSTNITNLSSALNLLVAARDAKVKRLVFASSSAIYGNDPTPAKHEGLNPDPLSPYALQKYAAEKYGQLFYQLYGLETVSLRYFNVFGPRQSFNSPYSGVIAKFCTSMLEGKAPKVFGDGLQSRDFVYVENVVAANLLAAQQPSEQVAGRVFNIASGQSINLLQLIEELNRLTGQSLKPEFHPTRSGDVRSSLADISAALRDLNYMVTTDWQTGLSKTLDFYRK